MHNEPVMDRRLFLRSSVLATATVLLPWMAGCKGKTPIPAGTGHPAFLASISGINTLRVIGKAYLKTHTDEADADHLYQKIMKGHPGNTPMSMDELTAYLNNSISADFLNDRLVVSAGWVLSITEARQCALLAILNPVS
jgi:hypothetical protein